MMIHSFSSVECHVTNRANKIRSSLLNVLRVNVGNHLHFIEHGIATNIALEIFLFQMGAAMNYKKVNLFIFKG
jgi:hypothetical protein